MPFDLKKFQQAQFNPRQESVPVPDMKDFFPEGEEPVWIVRGLTGQELGQAHDTAKRNKKIEAVLEGLLSDKKTANAEAIRKLIGNAGDVTEETAKRLEMLKLGSVDPSLDMPDAVKVCTVFPIEFLILTNTINNLTGAGQEAKKKP